MQVLIIGKPATSKTTFLVQLYSLMRSGNGFVKLDGYPESIKAIEDSYKRIRQGEETQPTPANRNIDLVLKADVGGQVLDLICPDYGGEQVNSITESREIEKHWEKMIASSSDWMLFLKVHDIIESYDVSNKHAGEAVSHGVENGSGKSHETILSDGAELVELLQILLFVKKQSTMHQMKVPRLKIVISRWDELHEFAGVPADLLAKKVPLLSEFAFANWQESAVSVWGLSAQGFDLKLPENKTKYLEEGNNKFAFVIRPDGHRSSDITELLISTL